MKWAIPIAVAGILTGPIFADVLDLEDLDQYDPQQTALPSGIGSNAIWIGQGTDGFHVALAPDVKSKVQGVLDGCGETDDQCYQDIHEVLNMADFEIDGKLDRRTFAAMLSKTFRAYGVWFLDIASILWSNFRLRNHDVQDLGLWIPDAKASDAGAVAFATDITISAGGTAVITITQTPIPTTLQGSATPSVTAATTASDGHASGDLVALLDKDFASRIDEYMRRSTSCEDGTLFDEENPSEQKRAEVGSYRDAICGAQAVGAAAVPGGPFNDLLLLDPTNLPFGFADATGAVAQAADRVVQFMLEYAPMLGITDELATQLGNFLFLLAYDAIINGIPLSDSNGIASSLVTTGTPTTTTTATSTTTRCPDPTESPLTCGMDGQDCDLKMPENEDSGPTCESGEYKDCPCNAPLIVNTNFVSSEQQQSMITMSNLLLQALIPPTKVSPTCPQDVSALPASLFSSEEKGTNVHAHFCEGWNSAVNSSMTVDSSGNNTKPEPQLKTTTSRRTPPLSPSDFSDWKIYLKYTPNDGDKECSLDCNAAYLVFASACADSSGGSYMFDTGSIDVGCGVFDYELEDPSKLTPIDKMSERQCHDESDFPGHADAHDGGVKNAAWYFCSSVELKEENGKMIQDPKMFTKDSSKTEKWPGLDGNNYNFDLFWSEGCRTAGGEQSAGFPTEVDTHNGLSCHSIMYDNWRQCHNGGVGGNITIGCLVYDYAGPA